MNVDIAFVLRSVAKNVPARPSRRVLRFALYLGELLRVPRDRQHLHVLSGTAWISAAGRDIVAPLGSCVKLVRSRYPALVSGLGGQPLLFEIW
ncbi:MAG: hypothetical protein ABSG38_01205 [Spirochaetia bacterium]|jgi:hypothetical protein